jgi:hypothetical protein
MTWFVEPTFPKASRPDRTGSGPSVPNAQAYWTDLTPRLVWLRSYATRVEQEVVRELPDPERGPEPHWRY